MTTAYSIYILKEQLSKEVQLLETEHSYKSTRMYSPTLIKSRKSNIEDLTNSIEILEKNYINHLRNKR